MSMSAHGARMDAIYAGQRHIYDATRKYYLLGRDRLIADLAPPAGGRVIEIGCGTGRNLIHAARRWPRARCYGFDISAAMLETAQAKIVRAGLHGRIALVPGDATAWSPQALFRIEAADAIFMSYTLSMIPDWQRAIEAGCEALAPGGTLHIVDFGQQERLPAAFRRALFAWLDRFEVTPRAKLAAVARDIAVRRGMTAAVTPLYRGYAWRAALRRPA